MIDQRCPSPWRCQMQPLWIQLLILPKKLQILPVLISDSNGLEKGWLKDVKLWRQYATKYNKMTVFQFRYIFSFLPASYHSCHGTQHLIVLILSGIFFCIVLPLGWAVQGISKEPHICGFCQLCFMAWFWDSFSVCIWYFDLHLAPYFIIVLNDFGAWLCLFTIDSSLYHHYFQTVIY